MVAERLADQGAQAAMWLDHDRPYQPGDRQEERELKMLYHFVVFAFFAVN
jgi:hypothetical protein